MLKNLKGFETRNVLLVRFMGRHAGNYTAFVSMVVRQQKAVNSSADTPMLFVIPIQIEVLNQQQQQQQSTSSISSNSRLYSPQHHILFGTSSRPLVVPTLLDTQQFVSNSSKNNINNNSPTNDLLGVAVASQPLVDPFASTQLHLLSPDLFTRSFNLYLANSANSPLIITVTQFFKL